MYEFACGITEKRGFDNTEKEKIKDSLIAMSMNTLWPLMENNITREDLDEVIGFLKTMPILTQSAQVRAFEQEWSDWLGVKYSVFLNSGSSANFITMALVRDRFGAGEIIVPPLTWVSDISSVLHAGHTPVFADINPKTLSMSDEAVLAKLSPRTKAVFLTHCQGFNGLTDRLLTALGDRGIPLIEDVCESHGATFRGRKLGSVGLVSNFSFYFAHHMSTIEGGMVCTNDENLYQRCRMWRSHGMTREMTDQDARRQYADENPELNPDFIFALPGFNMRNTEIGAVIGRNQLKRLDTNNVKRRENFARFLKLLDGSKYVNDFDLEGSCNYAFNLVLRRPDTGLCQKVMDALRANGIEFRRGSAGGGNQLRQPYLRGIIPADEYCRYPQTDHIHFFGFYIGNYPDLPMERIDRLCSLLNGL